MTQPDTSTLAALSDLVNLPEQGTVFTALVRKMGVEHGQAPYKRVYGDDLTRVLIWTGFSHRALIARSMKILDHQLNKGGYIEKLARATLEEHSGTTIEDVCHALQEVRDWFRRKLANPGDESECGIGPVYPGLPGTNPVLPKSVWAPLVINGVTVRGCSIYSGPARPEDPRAPIPGTIYVKGLKLGERLVVPAPNGQWKADSKPKTLAKNLILESLPVGLFCQYRLEPSRVSGVAVAAEAVQIAKEHKIRIDPGALTSMFKVA